MNGTSGFQELRSSTPDHRHSGIASCTSNGINSKQVSGTFSVLTISSLSPQTSAKREKRFLGAFSCFFFSLLIVADFVCTSPAIAADMVPLNSGAVEPSNKTTEEFISAFETTPGPSQHGLATFSRQLTEDDYKSLTEAGLQVLSPFHGTTYRVRVEKRVNMDALQGRKLTVQLIRLQPQDRVRAEIWRGEFDRYRITLPGETPRNYVLNPDGTLNLTVRFHPGIAESEIRRMLKTYGPSLHKQSDTTWVATVVLSKLPLLAAEDVVQWLDAGPPPFIPENDHTRAAIMVDPLLQAPWGLTGNGVQVGIFDQGIAENHPDLAGRVLSPNNSLRNNHGTHVAGIVAGSGSISSSSEGTPSQWKGMAPGAQLIEAEIVERTDVPDGVSGLFTGAEVPAHREAIINHGMDISNHSYAVSYDGVYDAQNQHRDELIRGIALDGGIPVPGRLHVYSAGNQGQYPAGRTVGQVGYFSLTKELKNGLIVGAWNLGFGINVALVPVTTPQIWDNSSLGPAYDGRIKPDVVAPGKWITSTCYLQPSVGCEPPNSQAYGYMTVDGTSMAAAAVTGALALVLEKYTSRYGATPPLPSSLRAVMIHTATDIVDNSVWFCNPDGPSSSTCPNGPGHAPVKATPGPDFVTGWGLINAEAAVRIVDSRLLLEGSITDQCETKIYYFTVPPKGAGTPIRITLAWDDLPADPAADPTGKVAKLINDLDLTVVAPNNVQKHYPWQLNQTLTPFDDVAVCLLPVLEASGSIQPNTTPGQPDAILVSGFPPAQRGRDHLNNAEVVDVNAENDAPYPLPVKASGSIQPNTTPGQPDAIPATGFPPAQRGRDHLNNVEVVDVPAQNVVEGNWQVQVRGFRITNRYNNMSVGPQRFSLVGPFPLTDTVPPVTDTVPPAAPDNLRVQ
jgi:subtilisin family serine protease/translation initiation factor IF-1